MKKALRLLRLESLQLIVLALPYLLAAALWDKLPARVVTHWDMHNHPNGWMPKAVGLLVPPTINVVGTTLFFFAPRIDPRLRRRGSAAIPAQRRAWRTARLGLSGFITTVCVVVVAVAAGWQLDVGWVCSMGGLVLLAIVGNAMANLEPNYLMGIRTPWTLEDPATWRATHRFGSRVMVFGSVALGLVGLFLPGIILSAFFAGFIALLALGAFGYSAWFYQQHAAQ